MSGSTSSCSDEDVLSHGETKTAVAGGQHEPHHEEQEAVRPRSERQTGASPSSSTRRSLWTVNLHLLKEKEEGEEEARTASTRRLP